MNEEQLAERQYGLITRAQARRTLSESAVDRRLASGRWTAVLPGVYRIVGAPVTGRQRAMAATLWGGDAAAISHTTAGRLLRLGVPHRDMHLTVDRRGLHANGVTVHHSALTRADRVAVDGIPCTCAARTLVDCAPFLDGEMLETAFEQARRMGLTSIAAVEKRLARRRPGVAKIRAVLAHAEARPRESRLEVKFARLLRTSGLPAPVTQFAIAGYRVDNAWLGLRVVAECDGFRWHGQRLQWKRDRRRIAAIEAEDWHVIHVTWEDVTERPNETLARVAIALRRAA